MRGEGPTPPRRQVATSTPPPVVSSPVLARGEKTCLIFRLSCLARVFKRSVCSSISSYFLWVTARAVMKGGSWFCLTGCIYRACSFRIFAYRYIQKTVPQFQTTSAKETHSWRSS